MHPEPVIRMLADDGLNNVVLALGDLFNGIVVFVDQFGQEDNFVGRAIYALQTLGRWGICISWQTPPQGAKLWFPVQKTGI